MIDSTTGDWSKYKNGLQFTIIHFCLRGETRLVRVLGPGSSSESGCSEISLATIVLDFFGAAFFFFDGGEMTSGEVEGAGESEGEGFRFLDGDFDGDDDEDATAPVAKVRSN